MMYIHSNDNPNSNNANANSNNDGESSQAAWRASASRFPGNGRRGDGPRTCLGGGCADTDAGSLRIDAAWRGVAVEFPGTREILRHRDLSRGIGLSEGGCFIPAVASAASELGVINGLLIDAVVGGSSLRLRRDALGAPRSSVLSPCALTVVAGAGVCTGWRSSASVPEGGCWISSHCGIRFLRLDLSQEFISTASAVAPRSLLGLA